ncbi:head maturation protease, ClpP-related [Fructilactobacillus fructivorans]|uniref:Clp protease ClpP n=1 Tax=Fructilactobacillus fructivorans TaxID=1614 RepID=A0AAE6P1C0_9LACO|nr:head maturation protease, ClpP-related [Fructilactobacillus fructivorans]KRK58497.1 protease subunit of ATP-dependent Clp protease [Fructilactobacillus fructivorans]KRN40051.1 protease subunit of ATP-dependent Clp protease [Fructilactobacillus fructivorans]QFX92507.1 Clp protease ClpP [Fructilactobacillus fructivorans]RDV65898.1 Clp protease ClpP [Fructilactobacillus fructivorans]
MTTIQVPIKSDVINDKDGKMASILDFPATYPAGVNQILDTAKDNDSVEVNINSGGGDVDAASEIYSELKNASQPVTVNILGMAGSSASIIAMAGDKINIAPTARIIIHKASVSDVQGNSDDLQGLVNMLSSTDSAIANIYRDRTGQDKTAIAKMMTQTTQFNADEAVENHFADEVMFENNKAPQLTNSLNDIFSDKSVDKFYKIYKKAKQYDEIQTNREKHKKSETLTDKKRAIFMQNI